MTEQRASARKYYSLIPEDEEGRLTRRGSSLAVNEKGWILTSGQHPAPAAPAYRVIGVKQKPDGLTPIGWEAVSRIIDADGPNTGYPLLKQGNLEKLSEHKHRISGCAFPIENPECAISGKNNEVSDGLTNAILNDAETDKDFRVWVITPDNLGGQRAYCTIIHLERNVAVVHSPFSLKLRAYSETDGKWAGNLLEEWVVSAKKVRTASATVIFVRTCNTYNRKIAFAIRDAGAERLPDPIAALMAETR